MGLLDAPSNVPIRVLSLDTTSIEHYDFLSSINLSKDNIIKVLDINITAGVIFISTEKENYYIAISYLKEVIVLVHN